MEIHRTIEKNSQDMLMKRRKKLYFLHIPKTSGVSIFSALSDIAIAKKIKMVGHVLLDHLVEHPKWTKSKILVGHLGLLPLEYNFEYFTVLRDPLERLFSHYSHIYRSPGHYLHNVVAGEELDFESYLLDDRFLGLNYNMQTRYLSYYPKIESSRVRISPQELTANFETSRETNVNLDLAINTLNNASWVGTPNTLNELESFLQTKFHLTDVHIPVLNVRPGPKKVFTSSEIKAAKPLTELDQIIFDKYGNRHEMD